VELEFVAGSDQDLRVSGFQVSAGSLDPRMSRNSVADFDHFIKTRERSDDQRLWSVRRYDRLQAHLGTIVNLSEAW
jgi:hypothetical protein